MERPIHQIPYSKKITDKDWQRKVVDYYRSIATPLIRDIDEYIKLYKIANGELDEVDYTVTTNPYNTDRKELKGYPSKLRNYDIISPIYQLLLAEKRKRGIIRQVVPVNVDLKSAQSQQKYEEVYSQLSQVRINALIDQGVADPTLRKDPRASVKEGSSLADELSILGDTALEYIDFYNKIPYQFLQGWADYVAQGYVVSYKDVFKDEIIYEIVPPAEIAYVGSSRNRFLEDQEAIIRTFLMTYNEAFEKFQGFEGFEEVEEYLKNKGSYSRAASSGPQDWVSLAGSQLIGKVLGIDMMGSTNEEFCNVQHVHFTSWCKVGKVTGIDVVTGNFYTEEVDENYKELPTETVEWEWVKETMECYVIDDRFILGMRCVPFTRASMSNPNVTKLLYNGTIFATRYNRPNSIVKKGYPYQVKYNIVYYHLEKMIAKNKDKIMIMPLELIPEGEGWDEFTQLYYADALSVMYVQTDNDPKKINTINAIKPIDLSLNKYIMEMYSILRSIKMDYEETVGITPQRKGDISAYSGKGTTDAAISRSYMMSENLFSEFDEFQNREYQGLLDLSQFAWVNGKKTTFRNSEMKLRFLDINPEKYSTIEYGVFVTNSKDHDDQLNTMKALVQPYMQNQGRPSIAAEILKSNNLEKLTQFLKEKELEIEAAQAQAAEREGAAIQAEMEQEENHFQQELEYKYYETDSKNDLELNKVLLGLHQGIVGETGNESDFLELQKITLDRYDKEQKNKLQEMEIKRKEREAETKAKIEREWMQTDKFVARTNRNKYSKK